MKEKIWCVYMHTNKINNKRYIGQTFQGVNYRWRENGTGYKGQPFHMAITKWGWDNFTHEILKDGIKTQEEADKWEQFFILKYNTYDQKYGYNFTKGGNINRSSKGYAVLCENKEFYSLAECSRYLNINESLLRGYLKKKRLPPPLYKKQIHFKNDDFSTYEEYTDNVKFENVSRAFKGKNNPRALPVICADVRYDTIKDFAKAYNLTNTLVARWLKGSVGMPQKFIDLGLRYANETSQSYKIGKEHKKKVICEGIIFESIASCAKYYQVERRSLNRYLLGRVKMKPEWVERGLRFA